MDDRRFDALARSLAASKSRRGFLGALAAVGAGLLGARAGAQVTQAQCGNKVCGPFAPPCGPWSAAKSSSEANRPSSASVSCITRPSVQLCAPAVRRPRSRDRGTG